MKLIFSLLLSAVCFAALVISYDDREIRAYHFHAYFFQQNNKSIESAWNLREEVNRLITTGYLGSCTTTCRLCQFSKGPDGPHPIGNFLTCCNNTNVNRAMDFFAKNRGNHSVLIHPLTEREIDDHSKRAAWIGPLMPLDESYLQEELLPIDICDKDWPADVDPGIVNTYFGPRRHTQS